MGYQAIIISFGELEHPDNDIEFVRLTKVGAMHGKISKIFHDQETIFKDTQNPLMGVRYNFLAAKSDILPQELKVSGTAMMGQ